MSAHSSQVRLAQKVLILLRKYVLPRTSLLTRASRSVRAVHLYLCVAGIAVYTLLPLTPVFRNVI